MELPKRLLEALHFPIWGTVGTLAGEKLVEGRYRGKD